MPKISEISRGSLGDLGQTFPQFTTAGSAGYGVSRKPYFVVNKAERIESTGFLNKRSNDYSEVVAALQGIGEVRGLSRVGAIGDLDGLDGVLADFKDKMKGAWGSVKGTVSDAVDKADAYYQKAKDYVLDPAKFASDLVSFTPGAQKLTGKIVSDLKKTQTNLYALYDIIQKYKSMGAKSPLSAVQIADIERGQQSASDSFYQMAYIMYAMPTTAKQMKEAGVDKPDITKPWVLGAIQKGKISNQVYELVKKTNKTGALSGLGYAPIAVAGIIAAGIAVIATTAYTIREVTAASVAKERARADAAIVEALTKAGKSPKEIKEVLAQKQAGEAAADEERNKGFFNSISKWLPWAVGGVLVVALLPTITAVGQRGAAAISVNGVGRYSKRRW